MPRWRRNIAWRLFRRPGDQNSLVGEGCLYDFKDVQHTCLTLQVAALGGFSGSPVLRVAGDAVLPEAIATFVGTNRFPAAGAKSNAVWHQAPARIRVS
mmetsp:Transcript_27568/g.50516  ORF Transcript_27568/g.50516 Transcript_27568/m.50516 type:complete len:98 (-) Transcript_27568:36-329(-)